MTSKWLDVLTYQYNAIVTLAMHSRVPFVREANTRRAFALAEELGFDVDPNWDKEPTT
jgi:hypothetical protein